MIMADAVIDPSVLKKQCSVGTPLQVCGVLFWRSLDRASVFRIVVCAVVTWLWVNVVCLCVCFICLRGGCSKACRASSCRSM